MKCDHRFDPTRSRRAVRSAPPKIARHERIFIRTGDVIPLAVAKTGVTVAAYVARNALPMSDLPALIDKVHVAFEEMCANGPQRPGVSKKPTSKEIAASFTKDHLVSFIDGKPYKTLKRHLAAHGLDPNGYRTLYGLPPDYPMAAPSYVKRRALLAKHIRYGHSVN